MLDAMLYNGRFVNPALPEFISHYEIVRFVFGRGESLPVKYLAPRPDQSLTFYPREAQRFSYTDSTAITSYPRAIVYGMHTVPVYRYGSHDFLAVRVVFQPGALYRLTGLPAHELTNTFADADAIWPGLIRQVSEQLTSTDKLTEMLTLIESFLVGVVQSVRKSHHAVDASSQWLLAQRSRISLDQLADYSCLSVRQFIRKFEERVGVSPKQFDRLARFDKAFQARNKHPALDWLSIVLACGYYDHQHFAKDCRELTLLSPTAFFEQEKQAAEHVLGLPVV